ncbi:hypothetical protein JCM10449v2_001161 [Rhodotorula kratochvilovae]
MPDSLFGSDTDSSDLEDPSTRAPTPPGDVVAVLPSSSAPPPIDGLYLFHKALPRQLHDQLAEDLSSTVWTGGTNQVMLFERRGVSSFPPFLQPLLEFLPSLLSTLPPHVQALLNYTSKPRQAILNLYRPGQGITPHIDLPTRYADGIIGVSLLSSTVMDFRPASPAAPPVVHSVRLRPGDVYVLFGPARWEWTHGIAYREEDVVADEAGEPMRVLRGTRMSITLRRMKDGAEVIGSEQMEEGAA